MQEEITAKPETRKEKKKEEGAKESTKRRGLRGGKVSLHHTNWRSLPNTKGVKKGEDCRVAGEKGEVPIWTGEKRRPSYKKKTSR